MHNHYGGFHAAVGSAFVKSSWQTVTVGTESHQCPFLNLKKNTFVVTVNSGQTDSQVNASFRHALNFADLRWLWSSSNLYASQLILSFSQFGHPNASRHKLIASHLYMREIYGLLRLANPFGRSSQVLILPTCVDLFGQGFGLFLKQASWSALTYHK